MGLWTWIAAGLIIGAWLVPWLLERRQSSRARDAALLGGIVVRLTLSAVFVWAIIDLLSHDDSLHRLLAIPVALVVLLTLFNAATGLAVLLDRRRD